MNEGGNNFGDSLRNIWQKISSPTHTRTLAILALLVIIAAVPLTVYIAQKQQEIRQRAASIYSDISNGQPCFTPDEWAYKCLSNSCSGGCAGEVYHCITSSDPDVEYKWQYLRTECTNQCNTCSAPPPPSCPSGHSCSNWKVKPDDCNWGYCCDPSITSCTGGQGAGVPYNWNGSSWNSTGGAECTTLCPVTTVPPTAPPTVPPTTIPGCSGGFASPAFTCGPLAPSNKLNIAAWNLTPPPEGNNRCNIYIRGGSKDFQIGTSCSGGPKTIDGRFDANNIITNDGVYELYVSNGQAGCYNEKRGTATLNCGAPTTPTNTPIPGVPTNTPTATPTFAPNDTILNFDLTLVGIGKNLPSGEGGVLPANTSPRTTTKELNVEIYQGANDTTPIKTGKGNIVYDSSSKTFRGQVSLGTDFATGNYVVKVRTDKFKKKHVGKGEEKEIQRIVRGQDDLNKNLNNLLAMLLNGDMNNDGTIDALDYNIYYNCFGDRTDASCGTNKFNVDLNDDGQTDQKGILAKDYRILLYAFSKVSGD